jgi:hypothetical protein
MFISFSPNFMCISFTLLKPGIDPKLFHFLKTWIISGGTEKVPLQTGANPVLE